jgi:hypothetical protein
LGGNRILRGHGFSFMGTAVSLWDEHTPLT